MNKIPFGERNGVLHRAHEVDNGLRCGCICPGCKRPLNAANQGEKVAPYFRHAQAEECTSGFKEGVRRAAVALIVEKRRMSLPGFADRAMVIPVRGASLVSDVQFNAMDVTADTVVRFVDFGDLLAHAVLHCADRQLLVRIRVSPRAEHERYRRLRALDHSSIEIDLSRLSLGDINDPFVFEHAVLKDPTNRVWIRSMRGEKLVERARQELQAKAEESAAAWVAEQAEREAAERARQDEREERQAERKAALAEHRTTQRDMATRQGVTSSMAGDCRSARQQREDLIVATIMKAVRDWKGQGVECSTCHLTNPPGTRFCLYCASDDSEMIDVTIPADVAKTIYHRMRSSVKPDRSVRSVPTLIVTPEL
ncbi:hypothetical protein D9M69_428760 [compost metagenome]